MRVNTPKKVPPQYTHEGGKAGQQTAETELRRAVSTCLLWENTFYEKGSDIAARMAELCKKVRPEVVEALALEARTQLKLRHVPLWLLLQLVQARYKGASTAIYNTIQRPDEMAELLALYWKDGRKPLAKQLKKGLAKTFTKFNEYNLAKWNRDSEIKLRDVMFMCHPKPLNVEQAATWKKLVDKTLESPDTWEVALSSGADKLATWTRLLKEDKLGDMALLMNLRNMIGVGVDDKLIASAIEAKAGKSKALPFRYVSALRYAPHLINALDKGMKASITGSLTGTTALVVDVSGSMDAVISAKSQMTRLEAAAALGILLAGTCKDTFRLWTFSERLVEVPAVASLVLVNTIRGSQYHAGTYLRRSLEELSKRMSNIERVIVITDEQSHDGIYPAWTEHAYVINVASYKPGLDVNQGWTRISGWSERVIDWIRLEEGLESYSQDSNTDDTLSS